jgi:hypothetical protein
MPKKKTITSVIGVVPKNKPGTVSKITHTKKPKKTQRRR